MKLILILFTALFPTIGLAQGCSDAGFCTTGGLKNESKRDSFHNNLIFGITTGIGEQSVFILQFSTECNLRLMNNLVFQAKLPYQFTMGNLGNTSGIGDATVAFTYSRIKNKSGLDYTLGGKIPIGKTNIPYSGFLSLPMPYQPGLGTIDLIGGVRYSFGKYSIAVGTQIVVSQNNINTFLPHLDSSKSGNYFPSNNLKRGNDILLRTERMFQFKKMQIQAGLLAIYRLKGDEIINKFGQNELLHGSNGLTLNLTAGINYKVSKHISLAAQFGMPVIVREIRADGLTRALVGSFQIKHSF